MYGPLVTFAEWYRLAPLLTQSYYYYGDPLPPPPHVTFWFGVTTGPPSSSHRCTFLIYFYTVTSSIRRKYWYDNLCTPTYFSWWGFIGCSRDTQTIRSSNAQSASIRLWAPAAFLLLRSWPLGNPYVPYSQTSSYPKKTACSTSGVSPYTASINSLLASCAIPYDASLRGVLFLQWWALNPPPALHCTSLHWRGPHPAPHTFQTCYRPLFIAEFTRPQAEYPFGPRVSLMLYRHWIDLVDLSHSQLAGALLNRARL